MNRLSFPALLAVAAVVLSAQSFPAQAQSGKRRATLPPVDFGKVVTNPSPEDITGEGGEAFPGRLDNDYLKDTLTLHHQIGLLERLIERQTAISKIENAYAEMGIPFRSVAPPREICVQLPLSIPCARGYPDLSAGVTDISIDSAAVSSDALPLPEIVVAPAPVENPLPPDPQGMAGREGEPEKYSWTEVSCAGGKCKAVLVENETPSIRHAVTAGDALPDGGGTVSAISFDGVLISRDGKTIPLEPAKAPSRGGPSSPVFGGGGAPPPVAQPPASSPPVAPALPGAEGTPQALPTGSSQGSGGSPTR